MTRPAVTATTERVYAAFPECYRTDDAALDDGRPQGTSNGFPLLRWLSLVGDQAGAVEHLIDRLDPAVDAGTGPGCELLDATRADPAWLPWLGQLLGVQPPPGQPLTPVMFTGLGRQHGSLTALTTAVRNTLVGVGRVPAVFVAVLDLWHLQVSTYEVQTPSAAAALAAAQGEAPAGVVVTHVLRPGMTWGQLPATAQTWGALTAAGTTWHQLAEELPNA